MESKRTFTFEIHVRTLRHGTGLVDPDEHGFIGRFMGGDSIQLKAVTPPNCVGLVLEASNVRIRKNLSTAPERHASFRQDVKVHPPKRDSERSGRDEPHTERGQNTLFVLELLEEPGRFCLHTASIVSDRGDFFALVHASEHEVFTDNGFVIPSLTWKWPPELLVQLFGLGAAAKPLRPVSEFVERTVERPANLAPNEAIVSWYFDSRGMGVLLGGNGKDYLVYRESLAPAPRGRLRTLKRGQIVTFKKTAMLPRGGPGTFAGEAQGVRPKN